MPQNPVHVWWSNYMLGLKCERTHRIIDSYSSVKGQKHRGWLHTPLTAAVAAEIADGPHCVPAALNHLLIDRWYDDPNMKVALEMMRLSQRAEPQPAPFTTRIERCRVNRR